MKAFSALFCWLAIAACSSDSSVCEQYKAALLARYRCDPGGVITLPVDGSYDAYRCEARSGSDASAEGLEQCTLYLQGLNEGCTVVIGDRDRCTTGLLVLR